MPSPEIEAKLREAGNEINYPNMALTQGLFAAQHEAEPYKGVAVTRDHQYGPDPRQRLDLFISEGAEEAATVLLFVHGGGFTRGDKRFPDSPYFDNVGLFAARNGLIGATMTYRLAPDHVWPSGREDVAAACAFLRGRFTGEVIALATSAGATHVADLLSTGDAGLAGAVLLSGIYDLADPEMAEIVAPYIGSVASPEIPLAGLAESKVPLLLTTAEMDPPAFGRQTRELVQYLSANALLEPRFEYLEGHNHFSGIAHLNGDDPAFSDKILRFVRDLES